MIDMKKIPHGGIWIPSSKKGSKWLVVALHGSGGSAANFQGMEAIFNLPELNYLYLNGPIREYSNHRWYTDSPVSRQNALSYLASIFDLLIQSGYSPSQTILIGFSQGAALSLEFGLRYAHVLAGCVAISGRVEDLPALLNQMRPQNAMRGKWLVTHGTKDYNLSIDVMRDQVRQLQGAGLSIDYREYPKIHEFDSSRELPDIAKWISKITHS